MEINAADEKSKKVITHSFIGKIGQNDHLIPEQKDHPFAGAN